MRKILLLAGVVFTTAVNAQYSEVLFSDKFDYPVGNVGTDTTGATPGLGGWATWISATTPNGAASNFQIVNNGAPQGTVLSVLGADNTAGSKFAIQDLTSAWGNRTDGSFAQVEYKFFNSTTASKNGGRVYVWDATATRILGGFHIVADTGEVRVLAYAVGSDGSTNNWIYTFNEPFYIPKDKWITLGINWDSASGEVNYLWDFADGEGTDGTFIAGAAAGMDLGDMYVGVVPRAGADNNTVASTGLFDDIQVFATDDIYNLGYLETLSVEDIKSKNTFSVFPNPTADFLNISTKAKVDNVQVYDMSGKMVKATLSNNQVDVRNLAKGSYVVKIQTAEGSSTQKFIKK